MNQETKGKYTVNGFLFGDEEDVELANQELAAIQFIDKKIENRSSETVLGVYQGALEKRMFRTPIGYCYLRELQKRLLKTGIRREQINAIPLYQVFNDSYKTMELPRRKTSLKKKTKKNEKLLRYSILANFIMGFLILLLFVIALMGETPNAINYRNAITNEYAEWEDNLKEREKIVREKEREFEILKQK